MKLFKYILAVGLTTTMASCSDYLDKLPITEPNSETFLNSESQLRGYINGLYIALPANKQFGLGIWEEDRHSDNIAAEEYTKRLNGETLSFDGNTSWTTSYQNLRDVNYFFAYNMIAEENWSEKVRSLVGEAYFFRAYWHFELLKDFGSVPVMDAFWDGNATVEGLQIPPRPRSEVARFILEDLDKAIALLNTRSVESGLRINREAAIAFAMRVALYEGSWEKYHAGTAFAKEDNSQEFFRKVVSLGDVLKQEAVNINTNGKTDGTAFSEMFQTTDLSDVQEALFWKKYSVADGVQHDALALLTSGISTMATPGGLTLSLINSYLNEDGTPLTEAQLKETDFNKMFEGRDKRLNQTVMHTGCVFKLDPNSGLPVTLNVGDILEDTVNNVPIMASTLPKLHGANQEQNVTGFHSRLGIDPTYSQGASETGINMIRLSEALLSYAEAKVELGELTAADAEWTIKPLRERAGVAFDATSITLEEVRRERRVELALQGHRFDDIMRWAQADELIVNKRAKGAYLGKESVLYQSYSETQREEVDLILIDAEGWMDPQKERLPMGYQFNLGRDYLLPIPPSELILNPHLEPTPGW